MIKAFHLSQSLQYTDINQLKQAPEAIAAIKETAVKTIEAVDKSLDESTITLKVNIVKTASEADLQKVTKGTAWRKAIKAFKNKNKKLEHKQWVPKLNKLNNKP